MRLPLPGLERRPVMGPLRIDGVAALGTAAVRRLLTRLLLDDDELLAARRGVASPEVAVVLADTHEDLPWFEGAIYVARLPDEPTLLLPTGVRPPLPGVVLLRALRAHAAEAIPPLVVLPQARRVVSLAEARPLWRTRLHQALEEQA